MNMPGLGRDRIPESLLEAGKATGSLDSEMAHFTSTEFHWSKQLIKTSQIQRVEKQESTYE